MLVDNEEIVAVLANKFIVMMVLALIELVNREKVEIVEGKLVIPPLPVPGRAPLILEIHKA